MDRALSAEEVAQIRQSPPSAKDLAKQLGVSKAEAEAILADPESLLPVWVGRETEQRLILDVAKSARATAQAMLSRLKTDPATLTPASSEIETKLVRTACTAAVRASQGNGWAEIRCTS